ncbi:MAG: isochorismatase family protein [Armatimonadota bacterium]|nr:isochorismatase family protein [Armatimonadota bacterium]
MERSEKLLSRTQSVLVLVDLQDAFLRHIKVAELITEHAQLLVKVGRELNVPIIATTQNATKLGILTAPLSLCLQGVPTFDKLTFSAVAQEGFARHLQSLNRTQVVLAGVETHICVMQTALDLLKAGYSVHVPYDAVASRQKRDWKYALMRLSAAGATITSVESVIYEWLHEAGTDEFRHVLPLLKAREQARLKEDSDDEEETSNDETIDGEDFEEQSTD